MSLFACLESENDRNSKPQLVRTSAEPAYTLSRRGFLGFFLSVGAAARVNGYSWVEDEEGLCSQSISHLVNKESGKQIYLIGTAHISEASAKQVQNTIRQVRPDAIMVELDKSRVASASEIGSRQPASLWQILQTELFKPDVDLLNRIRNAEASIIGLVIGSLYRKLNQMGFSSGQEFKTAIEEARELNATLILGDRGVKETLTRLQQAIEATGWDAIAAYSKAQTGSSEAAQLMRRLDNLGEKEAIASTVEGLKERATVRGLMASLNASLPLVYQALIGERDRYMAESLLRGNGKVTVAVVGMAHLDGIEAVLSAPAGGFALAPLCTDRRGALRFRRPADRLAYSGPPPPADWSGRER